MAETKEKLAKLFRNGGSQAVRLPKDFQFQGSEVRIRKEGHTVLLEPVGPQIAAKDVDTVRRVMQSLDPNLTAQVDEAMKKLQQEG